MHRLRRRPLLAARALLPPEGMRHIKKLLVPVDGSPPSIEALAVAVDLAEDTGATVEVLHVAAPDAFEVGGASPSVPSAAHAADRERLQAIRDAEVRLGEQLSARAIQGDPLREILHAVEQGAHDLIVIGTHGRIGRLHALLGSVAEGVVRNARCPVLTVRARDGESESFSERIHNRPRIGEETPR